MFVWGPTADIVQIISLLHSSQTEFAESDNDDADENFVGFAVAGCQTRLPYFSLDTPNRQVGTMTISGGYRWTDIDRDHS